MYRDLTKGNITKGLLLFALPMIAGNLLQQFYNIADTLIVGPVAGLERARRRWARAYTLMTFLTSIFLGLCDGQQARCSPIYLGGSATYASSSARSLACGRSCSSRCAPAVLNAAVYAVSRPDADAFCHVPAEVCAPDAGVSVHHFRRGSSAGRFSIIIFACAAARGGQFARPAPWFLARVGRC